MAYVVTVRYFKRAELRYLARDKDGWHTSGFEEAVHFGTELEAIRAGEEFRPDGARIWIEVEEADDLTFNPDWVSAPGDSIQEILEHYKLTPEWLAAQLELTQDDTQKLLEGDLEITDELSSQLARSLRGSADFWKNRERHYREGLAKGLKKI